MKQLPIIFLIATVVNCSDILIAADERQDRSNQSDPRWKFEISFPNELHPNPFTGRVYIFFSKTRQEPRSGPGWFRPEKFIARDVENIKPNNTVTLSSDNVQGVLSFPKPLDELELAGYRAQAVVRFNPFDRNIGTGIGNGYSDVISIPAPSMRKTFQFTINNIVDESQFQETKWAKLLKVHSKLLSNFHNRDVYLHAAVILPADYYDQPTLRYPAIFNIPGFGGTHFRGRTEKPVQEQNKHNVRFLRVMLDASSPLGHHVFADSANNGPVGKALITELIPEFDRQFRSISKPTARFLTGHSSGGWSSLWLQITYPHVFAATWSTAPDPVDFRDFQQINLYRPGENMYVDADGNERPLARIGGKVRLWYRDFDQMEWTLGPGGQLHSFEAVFSPRGNNGKPLLAWNRKTGEVNTDITKKWEKYDIRLVLERNWKTLGPKLNEKIHVFMGDNDTFYLEGATILLKKSLEKLNSNAVVEIVPGKDHFNLLDDQLRQRIRGEMVETFLKKHPEWKAKE